MVPWRLGLLLALLGACAPPTSIASSDEASASDGTTTPATTDPTTTTTGTTSTATGLELQKPIGKVPLSGCASFDYLAPFTVGTSTLTLLVDSGSTTMAAAASTCTSCAVDAKYTPSATAKTTGKTTSSSYLDGSGWSGTIITDGAMAGASTGPATPSVSLTFAEITQQQSFFSEITCAALDDTPFDGIAGMGPDTQLATGTTSFLTGLHAGDTTKRDAFALQTCDIGGTLWFGGYDASATTGSPNFTPLLQNRAYAVAVDKMAIGGVDLGVSSTQIGPMVVDNGTNAILLLSAAFTAFEQKLQANAAYTQNFNSTFISAQAASCEPSKLGLTRAQLDAALPRLAMTMTDQQGNSFTIDAPATSSYLVAGTISGDTSGMVYYCPSITTSTVGIIGNTFMRSHVVIFDREGKRVGFAPQTGCPSKTVLYGSGT